MRVIVTTVTVTTPGTRVRVSNTLDDVRVIAFHARAGNTGNTYVGTSDVSSTNGEELLPDGKYKVKYDDGGDKFSEKLNVWFVDAATGGDQVDVTVLANP